VRSPPSPEKGRDDAAGTGDSSASWPGREEQRRRENDYLVQALRTLEETLEKYVDLNDRAPFGYLSLDASMTIEAANAEACGVLGLPHARIVSRPLVAFLSRGEKLALDRHLAACRREGWAASRLQIRRRKGGTADIEVHTRYLPGSVWCYRMGLIDRRSLARADGPWSDAGGSDVVEVLARTSHELRGPLGPLLAAAQLLEGRAGAMPELKDIAATIRRNVMEETRLIEEISDAAKIRRGKVPRPLEVTDLHNAVREALLMLGSEAGEKRLKVVAELTAERSVVRGDADRLRQVFWNLLSNAIKFTPPRGTITVRSWNRDSSLLVEVADSGIGIPTHALRRLFTPFEQLHQRARGGGEPGPGPGLGLGLAICRGIVELHGGEIVAASSGRGRGARFVIELKLVARQDWESEEKVAPPIVPPPFHPPPGRRRGGKVLVVEDNRDMADALAAGLRQRGYEVRVASSMKAALRAGAAGVDVLVSDIHLPDGTGGGLLRQLQRRRPVKAISLSGDTGTGTERASIESGFLAHLTKPVEIEALTATIERALVTQ
jgi:signal transduction histidine kinase/CheY-like chemotaxis protein